MNEMQYFVSIENNAYCRWQAELLIESFKHHNLEYQLVIVIADNQEPDVPVYEKNLKAHDQKFVYMNFGKEYKAFNKTRSLIWALEQNILRKPFVLLHPDMLLHKPLEKRQESLVYDINNEYTEELKFILKKRIGELLRESDGEWFSWIPLGDTMIFGDNVPYSFFKRVHYELELLVKEHGPDSQYKLEKGAWLLAIYREFMFQQTGLTLTGDFLEQSFSAHNEVKNIIHYRHGILPEFNKYHYLYEPPMFMALHELNPIDAIYENNMTSTTHFARQLIEKYRETTS